MHTPTGHAPTILQAPCVPKGLVRTFKVINVPQSGGGKTQTGPLLSARLCDLDVLWQRAAQLRDASVQVGGVDGQQAPVPAGKAVDVLQVPVTSSCLLPRRVFC